MKKVILISVFCLIAFINGYTQTKQESIKELFHVMQTDSLTDKMLASMAPALQNQMMGQIADSASKVNSAYIMKSIMQTVKEISKKMLDEDMVGLYDKYFTQDEIKDYIRFYKTPSGQKFLNVMPDLQKDLMAVMMQKYMPEIQKTLKEKFDAMKNDEKK
jgi:hypothetical protein